MFRFVPLCVVLAACVADTPPDLGVAESAASVAFRREHVVDDIYHYEMVLPAGDGANAALRVHRVVREQAPFVPRHTRAGAMLLHGDFSTFVTNFAPTLGSPASPVVGLAPYLAAHDIDVWGVDRRWTLPGPDDDTSDFATMGVAQDVDDVRSALAFARGTRAVTGSGAGKLALVGFSHGGQLAYTYAAVEGSRPPAQRHVGGLVVLDYYGDLAPEDEDVRAASCEYATFEYELAANGETDAPNDIVIAIGELARTSPDEESPFAPPATNRDVLLQFAGQTYVLAPFAPLYHLAAPILDGDVAVGLRESSEAAIGAWFEGAPPHQAMLEYADFDRLLCGEGALPVSAPLSQIEVPLLYLGAAGGIGTLGLHATTSVSSTEVTTMIVQRFTPDRRAEDFGHGDLVFAADAPSLAWQPLAAWLLHH